MHIKTRNGYKWPSEDENIIRTHHSPNFILRSGNSGPRRLQGNLFLNNLAGFWKYIKFLDFRFFVFWVKVFKWLDRCGFGCLKPNISKRIREASFVSWEVVLVPYCAIYWSKPPPPPLPSHRKDRRYYPCSSILYIPIKDTDLIISSMFVLVYSKPINMIIILGLPDVWMIKLTRTGLPTTRASKRDLSRILINQKDFRELLLKPISNNKSQNAKFYFVKPYNEYNDFRDKNEYI